MLSHLFAITCVCWYVHFLFTTLCFSHKVLLIGLTKSKKTLHVVFVVLCCSIYCYFPSVAIHLSMLLLWFADGVINV